MIEKTINMLGRKARDRVTGYRGTITSVCFDLYGCVQVWLTPDAAEGQTKLEHGHWFDVARMEFTTDVRVMPVPMFGGAKTDPQEYAHGPAEKAPPRA